MNMLKKKLGKNGGFTLVEMLIVVAIIAILIAVSIPLVNNALDRARQATDAANIRSAKAELMIRYLSETAVQDQVYYYNAAEGSLTAVTSGFARPDGYGKVSGIKDNYLVVVMHENIVYYQWFDKTDNTVPITVSGAGALTGNWKTVPNSVDAAS